MDNPPILEPNPVTVVDYDPAWRELFEAERSALLSRTEGYFTALEHVGSTAIPGQRAKPIIDMMAAVERLDELEKVLPGLERHGYSLFETGMRDRHFLRRQNASGQSYHLHIVARSTWDERNERLLRDYLLRNPDEVEAYSDLKTRLADIYAQDSYAYTEAKTDFIQTVVDKARDELGLPRTDVWE